MIKLKDEETLRDDNIGIGIKSNENQINLFKLGNVGSCCPISRAKGSCIKRASIPDRIGI